MDPHPLIEAGGEEEELKQPLGTETQETISAISTQPRPWEQPLHADDVVLTQHAPPSPPPPPAEPADLSPSAYADDPSFIPPQDIDVSRYAAQLDLSDVSDDDGSAAALAASTAARGPLHPIERCNWLSLLTWWWVGDIFRVGKQRRLVHSDLHPPPLEDQCATISRAWEQAWAAQLAADPTRCPSVWRTLIAIFGWRYFVRGLPLALVSLAKIAQPLLLRQLVLYLESNDGQDVGSQGGVGIAFLYAVLLFLACVTQSVVQHWYFFCVYRQGGQTRIALSSAIYRQALSLQTTHFLSTSTGSMTNLVAADAGKLEELVMYAPYVWDAPIEIAVTLGLLIHFIGVSALVGMGVLFSLVPLQSYFSRLFASYRRQAVQWTDLRIKTINEILTGASVVKQYTYERPLEAVVTDAREHEFTWLRKANYLRSINMAVFFFSSPLINLLTFITYHSLGNTLSPANIFVTVSLFNSCRLPVTTYAPTAVQSFAEARVSVGRIQAFMQLGFDDARKKAERDRYQAQQAQQAEAAGAAPPQEGQGSVTMQDASFKWDANSKEEAGLYNLSFTLPPGQLSAIIGPIGACKSSLLCAMLGEMAPLGGTSTVRARSIAYAAQQAWIFADTLRENVLLGRPMRRGRYIRTLYACCLIEDIDNLPAGDLTVIGEKGVNLSGGQKARVALARAVYGECDLYLFDDCLAALDAIVAQRVFMACMSDQGLLKGRTRVLVTHQTQVLYRAQHLILLEAGRISAQGSWTDMVAQPHVRAAMHVTGEEGNQHRVKAASKATPPASRAPSMDSTHSTIPNLDSLPSSQLSSSTHLLTSLGSSSSLTDAQTAPASPPKPKRRDGNSILSEEVSTVGTVGLHVYASMLSPGGGLLGGVWVFLVLVVFMVAGQGVSITSDRWLAIWSAQSAAEQADRYYEYVYVGLVLGAIVLGLLRSFFFFRLVVRGAHKLHARMFHGVLYSPLRWFEANPTGRVLNRFSKDQSTIDENLALTAFDAYQMFWMVLGALASVASVAPYILAVVAPFVPLFLWLRKHYLTTSREVKRLDAVSRSPIYAYFSSTLSGLSTVRAFRVTDDFARSFAAKIDYNTFSVVTFYTTTRWFGVRLDSICTLIVLATGLLIVGLRNSISAAEAGFALTYSLLLTSLFQWGVRQSAEVENQMTSAERIIQYGDLPPEGVFYPPTRRGQAAVVPAEPSDPSQSIIEPEERWPRQGSLAFSQYCMRYRDGLPLVLKGLTFEVRPREKIGVCGTTGAGKSSLFAAIFRLVEGASGSITIDGVDTSRLPLHTLRSALSIIPQSPVIFSNTLRYNLDPFNEHADSALWEALEAVQLKDLVSRLSDKLSTQMSENGSNFSVGECQLLCVARAILKPSRILLVDEATANVDRRTDALLQHVIRQRFVDRSVITIAHRLVTIASSDRVLVMKDGVVAEFDTPEVLLQTKGGIFARMMQVAQGGESEGDGGQTAATIVEEEEPVKKERAVVV